jgi:hypothetical protein
MAGGGSEAPSNATGPSPGGPGPGPRRPGRYCHRVAASVGGLAVVLAVGTLGLHVLASASYLNAFYFECMLATGQGPPFALTTGASKLFASAMAFVSVGSVVTSLVFVLGPLLGRLWREGVQRAEEEARRLERAWEHRAEPPARRPD